MKKLSDFVCVKKIPRNLNRYEVIYKAYNYKYAQLMLEIKSKLIKLQPYKVDTVIHETDYNNLTRMGIIPEQKVSHVILTEMDSYFEKRIGQELYRLSEDSYRRNFTPTQAKLFKRFKYEPRTQIVTSYDIVKEIHKCRQKILRDTQQLADFVIVSKKSACIIEGHTNFNYNTTHSTEFSGTEVIGDIHGISVIVDLYAKMDAPIIMGVKYSENSVYNGVIAVIEDKDKAEDIETVVDVHMRRRYVLNKNIAVSSFEEQPLIYRMIKWDERKYNLLVYLSDILKEKLKKKK